jgi:hypothetical protein
VFRTKRSCIAVRFCAGEQVNELRAAAQANAGVRYCARHSTGTHCMHDLIRALYALMPCCLCGANATGWQVTRNAGAQRWVIVGVLYASPRRSGTRIDWLPGQAPLLERCSGSASSQMHYRVVSCIEQLDVLCRRGRLGSTDIDECTRRAARAALV